MAHKYSTKIGENCAKAVGVSLPISQKQSIMICDFVRNKSVQLAKKQLAEVIVKKRAIPFTRFNDDMGHKAGMAAGRFPVKACTHILALLESAEANAQFKGLSTADLIVYHISAQQGPGVWRQGRHHRRQAKRTHIEIVLEERKKAKKKKTVEKESRAEAAPKKDAPKKKEVKQETSKAEARPAPIEAKTEVKKEEVKAE